MQLGRALLIRLEKGGLLRRFKHIRAAIGFFVFIDGFGFLTLVEA